MASERPPFDARPRAVTPYEGFGSRPNLKVADPLEGVPRLRAPSNLGEAAARIEREARDTDHDEITPAERPFEIRVELRLEKLEKLAEEHGAELQSVKLSSRSAAQHALETHTLIKAMDRRQRRFMLENKWRPWIAWAVTTAIAVFALYRTYH